MTDDNLTPDDDMGDNFNQAEKQIAKDAIKLSRRYDTLLDKHEKVLTQIHEVIIAFGRLLLQGREMYGSDDYEFGQWIKRRHLDTSKLGRDQPARNACMNIARLHDHGVEAHDADVENGVVVAARLDLTGCRNTTPGDIMKWARKHQPHLFPHVRPRNVTPQPRKPPPSEAVLLLRRVLAEAGDKLTPVLRRTIEEALARLTNL